MAIVRFASLDACDVVEVEFVASDGSRLPPRPAWCASPALCPACGD
jgi:hypothetical protein